MDQDDDDLFLYGDEDGERAAAAPAVDENGNVEAPIDQDEGDEEDDDSESDLEIILDGEGTAPPPPSRRPAPIPIKAAIPILSPSKASTLAPATAPVAAVVGTTEYTPVDRPTMMAPAPSSRPQVQSSTLLSSDPTASSSTAGPTAGVITHPIPSSAEAEPASIDVNVVPKDSQGNDLFDIDIDLLEDKPWRKPGANMADYFNYGMNEAAWKDYSAKQRRTREEAIAAKNPFAAFATGNIQEAWQNLPPEMKTLLMGTIMGASAGMAGPMMGGVMGATNGGLMNYGNAGAGPMNGMMNGMNGMNMMGINGVDMYGNPLQHQQQQQLQHQQHQQHQLHQQQQFQQHHQHQQHQHQQQQHHQQRQHHEHQQQMMANAGIAASHGLVAADDVAAGGVARGDALAGGALIPTIGDPALDESFNDSVKVEDGVEATDAVAEAIMIATGVTSRVAQAGWRGASFPIAARGGRGVGRGGIPLSARPAAARARLPSPLPANIPTGPRAHVAAAAAAASPTRPAAHNRRTGYQDKDRQATATSSTSEGLDYGAATSVTSPNHRRSSTTKSGRSSTRRTSDTANATGDVVSKEMSRDSSRGGGSKRSQSRESETVESEDAKRSRRDREDEERRLRRKERRLEEAEEEKSSRPKREERSSRGRRHDEDEGGSRKKRKGDDDVAEDRSRRKPSSRSKVKDEN